MKYIRTKDGRIFDKSQETIIFNILYPRGEELLSRTINLKEDILKQANTIEELCDEFVVEDRDEFAIFHNLKLAKQTKGIIYGAIWCDFGLKYVARMNSDGVLELL